MPKSIIYTETRLVPATVETINEAAALIRAGELVAFPTETVYGLGANAQSAHAVARIFTAKGRPTTDPLIVHVADRDQLAHVVSDVSPLAEQLIVAFWPGALTLVMPRHANIPPEVSAGLPTVAVRMPNHPVALALLDAAGLPIAAPSANRFAHTSPTTAQHVYDDLAGRLHLILDGGPTVIGVESTILDLTSDPPRILRPGGVSLDELRAVIPEITLVSRYINTIESEPQIAPGQLLTHYAPRATLYLFEGSDAAIYRAMREAAANHQESGQHVGLLIADEDRSPLADLALPSVSLGQLTDLSVVAQRLFAGLRDLDSRGVTVILARSFADNGLGTAIRDRLIRAAAGRLIRVE
jgi:L-threonylcarbamoyladenylate synthase